MSTDPKARAWVEVSAESLRENVRTVARAVGKGVRIIPMVKADAYGLGMAQTVTSLEPLDPWGFGVAAVEEGLGLRALGVRRPVVVFSPVPPGSYKGAVEGGLAVSVGDLGALTSLRDAALKVGSEGPFHLEVNTGMGRAGFDWDRVQEWGPAFSAFLAPPLKWEGCFTHFHSADALDPGSTILQWNRLNHVVSELPPMPEGALLHACNSPGALRMPGFGADAVRPGIFIYGGVAGDGLPAPAPVASLRARIVFLRDVPAGATVGYGATYAAARSERWASVSIGYGDGLPRLLGNRGEALVKGHRCPIIGRISMDATVLDVTGVEGVEMGAVATFIGKDGEEEISVEEVAGHAQTINYEVLTGLTRRLPRIWTDHEGY